VAILSTAAAGGRTMARDRFAARRTKRTHRRRHKSRLPALIFTLVLVMAFAVRTYIRQHGSYPDAPRNCPQARALGLENIPESSPYYAPWLDRDGNGMACETWHNLDMK
jgi:hypothetical protein